MGADSPQAHDGTRTRDLFLTKEVLCRLSYVSIRPKSTPGGNRTPNRRFWRPVLYQLSYRRRTNGQGGNRTPDTSIFSRMLYQLSYLAHLPWPANKRPAQGPGDSGGGI